VTPRGICVRRRPALSFSTRKASSERLKSVLSIENRASLLSTPSLSARIFRKYSSSTKKSNWK
jgi:hypothetical protein